MKFSNYTPAVAPNSANPGAVHAQSIPTERPSGSRGYEAMAAAFGQITGMLQKKQDEDDAADVMKARNEIMTSLTGQLYGENGLMTTGVGENARGLTDRVTQTINKTFEEVSKNYNARVRKALQGNLNENMANYQRLAGQQEGREFTKQKELNYNSALSLNADNIAANYMDSDIIDGLLSDSMTLIQYRAHDQGWSGIQLEQEKRLKVTGLVGGAIENAINDGNLDQADMLLGRYRGSMSQEAVMKYELRLRGEESIKISREMGEDLYAKFGNDTEAARKYIYDTLSAQTETVGGGGVSTIDGLMAAIGGQESGGDYDAENGRTGAHGKYQIMPENWPSWAEEAGLGANAPRTPENQERVARYKLSQYLQQYGPEGAMVAWYSGPANAERWANGESTDVYGRSWDAKNGNGDEPSIREYVQQVSARGGNVDVDSAIRKAISDIDVSKPLPEGRNGCAHAANYLLSYVNPWNRQQMEKGGQHMAYVPTLVEDARKKDGPGVTEFSESKLHKGDMIVYKDPNDAEGMNHVVVYTGNGPGDYRFAGNSSNANDGQGGVITGDDYRQMGGLVPQYIIKTGSQTSGGGGHTRKKYTEKQLDSIWQQYNARVNDGKRKQAAASQSFVDGCIGQLDGMNEAQAGEFLERLRNGITTEQDAKNYNAVKAAANAKFDGAFNKTRSGGGSVGSGERTYYNGASGSRYTANQIEDAKALFDEYEERRNDPAETISRTDQRRYNKAARILNDVQGNSGDNLSSKEGLQLARHAVSVTSSDEEAEWYLIVNGEFSESEAKAYVEMVHGDEEG